MRRCTVEPSHVLRWRCSCELAGERWRSACSRRSDDGRPLQERIDDDDDDERRSSTSNISSRRPVIRSHDPVVARRRPRQENTLRSQWLSALVPLHLSRSPGNYIFVG